MIIIILLKRMNFSIGIKFLINISEIFEKYHIKQK